MRCHSPRHARNTYCSHIVLWREATGVEERDLDNGILLSPVYDALVDRHLIRFDNDGYLIVSPLLDSTLIDTIVGIDLNARVELTGKMIEYIARHRARLKYKCECTTNTSSV